MSSPHDAFHLCITYRYVLRTFMRWIQVLLVVLTMREPPQPPLPTTGPFLPYGGDAEAHAVRHNPSCLLVY